MKTKKEIPMWGTKEAREACVAAANVFSDVCTAEQVRILEQIFRCENIIATSRDHQTIEAAKRMYVVLEKQYESL